MVKSHMGTIRGLKETPQAMALRALRTIIKSSNTALQIDQIPTTLLYGDKIDFHRWSLILRDEELLILSQQKDFDGPIYLLDTSASTVAGMFRPFWYPSPYTHGIIELNLSNAVEITDYGITILSRANPSLSKLNLTSCVKITDIGLREIALSCPKLLDLNMSGCLSVQGDGVLAIGTSCPYLSKLSINYCTQIANWSLQRIFRQCTHLEYVCLSYLREITDDEVRTLSENCPHLFHLEAIECRYLSDQCVLGLSSNCRDLSYLDMSRTDMTYRVSDISLMSLGQRSRALLTLKFNHCDSISDVGITWLSEGCPALQTLELYGCSKITDAGLRILGSNCKQLTSLDISHAKCISDVGLANLSKGCHHLRTLKCHGVFLLSDPRFFSPQFLPKPSLPETSENPTIPKNTQNPKTPKGTQNPQNDMIFEDPIGIPALVNNCPELTTLDLSGCFRLNKVLSHCISQLTALQKINLRGCNQVTSISLISLVSGCSCLTEIDFSECGKSVNNEVLLALQRNCADVKTLLLHKSPMVTAMGIKAVSQMSKLRKLELNTCRHLTDAMCVSLTQVGNKNVNLNTLSVIDCMQITDSFLAWLSMKSDHQILTLATQGSGISNKALLSCRDQFPNCEIVIPTQARAAPVEKNATLKSVTLNSPFAPTAPAVPSASSSSSKNDAKVTAGYVPRFRIQDRILINHYYKVILGITKIQSRQRKYRALMRVQSIQDFIRRVQAQRLIQRIMRGFLARKKTHVLRWQQKLRQRSAIKITSIFHMVVAYKVVRRLQKLKKEKHLHVAASKMELCWRCYRDRRILQRLKVLQVKRNEMRVAATIIIQSVLRMCLAKIRVFHIRVMNGAKVKLWDRKATVIQRVYRGGVARDTTNKFKHAIAELHELQLKSAVKIQYQFRKHRTKVIVVQNHTMKVERYHAATSIQAVIRGFLARLSYQEMYYEYRLLRRKKATLRIQCLYRVYKARTAFFEKLKIRTSERQIQAYAGLTITRAARIKLAFLKYNEKQRQYYDRLRTQASIALNAATKIQALFRRYQGRILYFRKLEETKSKWKELFDEEKRKRFFYNQQTGEIRWRIPQDLLDLIPHPICDNCSCKEAILECKVCNELYCGPCFTRVHHGGRRKLHEYRSLYDFYGKRLDYGDGDFPCQWPSEVIQDEIQGWMLRVAPQRPPRHIYKQSQWEEYQMEDDEIAFKNKNSLLGMSAEQQRVQASVGKAAPSVFYFNRQTFETSYEMPAAVQDEIYQHQNKRNNNYYLTGNDNGYTTPAAGATTAADPMMASSQYMMQLAMGTGRVSTAGNNNDNVEVDYSAQGYYDPNGNWVWYESDYSAVPLEESYDNYVPPSYGGDAAGGGGGIAFDGYASSNNQQQQKQQQKTSTLAAMMRSSTGHSYHYGSLQEEYYHDLSSDTGSHM